MSHYWKLNKESKKNLRETANRLIGYDKRPNPHWKDTWKYYIKREYPWGGLIQLIQYKISEEYEYVKNYSKLCEDSKDEDLNQMEEVLNLGWKIIEHNYEEEWHNWYKTNSVSVTYVYRKIGERPLFKDGTGMLSVRGELLVKLYKNDIFDEILGENWEENWPGDDASKKERKNWLKSKKTCKLTEWLDEYNKTVDEMNINLDDEHKQEHLTINDITCAYSSEWCNGKSDKENHKYSDELIKKANKEYQNDKKKYFTLIAKYYDGWSD